VWALGKEELRNKVDEQLEVVMPRPTGICCRLPHWHVVRGCVWLVVMMPVASALAGGLGPFTEHPAELFPSTTSIATSNDQPFRATPKSGPRAAHHGVRIWLERG